MPKKSAYSIYRGAGASTGKYQASLYGVEDVWGRIESSQEKTVFKQEQTERKIDTLMSALELGSEIYGGVKSRKEFKGTLEETQVSMAETAYGKSELGTAEGAEKWVDLGEDVQSEWMEKFKPAQVDQSWADRLFGEEKKYKFGESEAFSKSEITAAGGLRKAESLESLMNIGGEDKYKDVLKIVEPDKVDEFPIEKTSTTTATEGDTTQFVAPPPVAAKVEEFPIKEESGGFKAFNPLAVGNLSMLEESDLEFDYEKSLEKLGL